MKSINKIVILLLMVIGVVSVFSSCQKDVTGTPTVSYVRVTNPQSSDSLLVGAKQGQLIAIVGTNLQDAVEVWFNDQQSRLTPTYITNTSILATVPSQIPASVTNKLKIVFKSGYTLLYDFQVQISKPDVSSMVCEYVNAGDVATVRGNYFYPPLTVTFTGGDTAKIVAVTDNQIQFTVPAGAQPGPITVKTNFGVNKSDFWFRDNRNIFISSDPWEGWNGQKFVVTNPGPGDPPKINGNYIHVKQVVNDWPYLEVADGPAANMPIHSKRIPDAAILNPKDYYLKFEVNTIKPYNNNIIKINAGTSASDADNYQWKPPYDTKGQWQTVVIPYDEVVSSYKVKPTVNPDGYWSMILIHGPGTLDADICFDNFRVVPKVSK